MGFLGIYKALYDYTPQAEGELQIAEGDVLYVLEKSTDDDWWKAKKKATAEDDDEPVGLIPNNYVEEVQPQAKARALYEYTRQTDEELSFTEDAQLTVFDTSDPDWILVGHDGDYGFVPANYIEIGEGGGKEEEAEPPMPTPPPLPARTPSDVQSPPLPARNQIPSEPSTPAAPASPPAPNPATMIAGMMAARAGSSQQPPAPLDLPPRPQYADDESEPEAKSPPLPARPRGDSHISIVEPARPSPPPEQRRIDYDSPRTPRTAPLTPGDFHMYNINEMVSIMGKKKKMPTTLGINLRTGMILIAPEHAQDGPSMEWTADRMTHYSREGKHVFMELVKPSKSIDFHAGAKDTAEEIVTMLGELAGAVRAEGLREVIMAATTQKPIQQKKGVVMYDFMAQGEDEVTVGIGDEVIVLDDTKSDEWWMVRRVKNQKEGVVPSSYIEVTGILDTPVSAGTSGVNAGKSTIEQNRMEEARLTKEAIKAGQREDQRERDKARSHEVGPGLLLPERNSSLLARNSNTGGQQRSRRENGRTEASGSSKSNGKSKPDPSKIRTWTDRTKSFTVEAQFLGIKDGKLNLHKTNGVRIAVPVAKMSLEDLEYVERMTGISLDEDKPLSDLKKRSGGDSSRSGSGVKVGASVQPKKPDYDWFQFFLSCDVQPGLCERYAQAFARESMDESVLPDVDATVLRNLGLREGDIIKVTRFLDAKYCRGKKATGADDEATGGLFSGPGGALRNNTRKGRPAPPVETNNTVDPNAFSQQKASATGEAKTPSPTSATTPATTKPTGGFEDDAWDVKPSKTSEPATQPPPAPAAAPAPAASPAAAAPAAAPAPSTAKLTGSMQELSLLTQPLTPEKVQSPVSVPPALNLAPASATSAAPTSAPAQIPQPTGATPGFFSGMQPPAVNGTQQQLPQAVARQRPMAPQYTQGQGGLMPPPPPSRPLSAPQSAHPSAFAPPPLQPQMTGYQTQVAPPGQSLNEMAQARMQQQYAQMQQQQQQPLMPMMTGMPGPAGQFMAPQPTGMLGASGPGMQMGLQPQPTGFNPMGQFPQQQQIGGGLPAPLEPQRTAMPTPTGPMGVGMGMNMGMGGMNPLGMQQPPQPMQPQPTGFGTSTPPATGGLHAPMQPLVPQKTGPPPPVRFGVTEGPKKLAPQPTGRRANLAAATPDNPFGF
ncbi:Actin cytoskeleton-regulatory complex protein sla1 [Madurella mycetomatis]|uniref:Actin cytoskeleton-regulatory complex protein SLA1 n=1 Tax=Madurella mycetomatis TaxID=100816 RepID=A0A175VRD6_9PEZI|nr:Actin cytoskeleton-regulatory complex protein sla1 [Madurella mycetomatis]